MTTQRLPTANDADGAAAADAGDIGTADLHTRLGHIHQKQRWFLRARLKAGNAFDQRTKGYPA